MTGPPRTRAVDPTHIRMFGTLWIALLVFAAAPALAQRVESPAASDNIFQLGMSLGYEEAREDLLVPLRWRGTSLGLRLGWARETPGSRQGTSLLLPLSVYWDRFGYVGLVGVGPKMYHAYVREVGKPGPRGSFNLGGLLRWQMHNGQYLDWDDEHIFWFSAFSAGPRFEWRSPSTRATELTGTLDAALVAAVSRPTRYRLNKIDDVTTFSGQFLDTQKHFELTGPPAYVSFHAGLSARRPHSKFVFAYDLDFSTYDSPARVVTVAHRIGFVRELGRNHE